MLGKKKSGLPVPDTISYFEAPRPGDPNHLNILALDTKSGLDKNFQRKLESTASKKLFDYIHTITEALKKDRRNATVYGGFLLPDVSFDHLKNRVEAIGKARKQTGIDNKIIIFINKGMSALLTISTNRSVLNKYDVDLEALKESIFNPLSNEEIKTMTDGEKAIEGEDWSKFNDLYLTAKDNGVYIISPAVILKYIRKHTNGKDIFKQLESHIIDIAKEKAPR